MRPIDQTRMSVSRSPVRLSAVRPSFAAAVPLLMTLSILVVTTTCDESPAAPAMIVEEGTLSVGGTYEIAQEWVEEGCGLSGELRTLSGRVTHAVGADRLTLVAGEAGFVGSVEPSGRFQTDPISFTEDNGALTTIDVSGNFSAAGFDAELMLSTMGAADGSDNCSYRIAWTASLQGGMNVIPGA